MTIKGVLLKALPMTHELLRLPRRVGERTGQQEEAGAQLRAALVDLGDVAK